MTEIILDENIRNLVVRFIQLTEVVLPNFLYPDLFPMLSLLSKELLKGFVDNTLEELSRIEIK